MFARKDDEQGAAAKRRLVESNLRLVVSIAKGYSRKGLSLLNVIQEGNLGLVRAIHEFDPDSGSNFKISATTEIRRAITDSIDNSQSG